MTEKIKTAQFSALASLALTGIKLTVALLTGSLALQAESIHSAIDTFTTIITLVAVRVADLPADRNHNYGHGKVENLSAFAEAIILIITVIWIIRHAFETFVAQQPGFPIDAKYLPYGFAVVLLAIGVDITRSIQLYRTAKKFGSQALEADALHYTTDLFSSSAVLVGLLAVKIGGQNFWWADPVAALVVAAIMGFAALKLAKMSIDVLVDRAPEGIEEAMQNTIRRVPGVCDVPRVRARKSGNKIFVDATITVDPQASMERGHQIASSVEFAAGEENKDMDITIHVEPADQSASKIEVINELAQSLNLKIHALRIRIFNGQLYVNFHLELPPLTPLTDAHKLVTTLEDRIRLRLPEVAEIDSHLEPSHA